MKLQRRVCHLVWLACLSSCLFSSTAFAQEEREDFTDLCDFLRLYNGASTVLRKKRDFYDLMTAYIARCKEDNVRYAEIFFDPQSKVAIAAR